MSYPERGRVITPLSSLGGHEKGATGQDPLLGVRVLTLHLQASLENEGRATHRRHVHGALIHAQGDELSAGHCGHMHDRELGMELLQDHLLEVTLFTTAATFPSGTFKEETVDIGTSSSELWEVGDVLGVEDCGLEHHLIKRQ